MNIKELIEKLQNFDPNLKVLVNGYEGGFQSLNTESFKFRNVVPTPDKEWYFGDWNYPKPGEKGEQVLIISR